MKCVIIDSLNIRKGSGRNDEDNKKACMEGSRNLIFCNTGGLYGNI